MNIFNEFKCYSNSDWSKIGFLDGLKVGKFDLSECQSILCHNYRWIVDYVNSLSSYDYDRAYLYLPIFRRVYGKMLDMLNDFNYQSEDKNLSLLEYSKVFCDPKFIIDYIDLHFDNLNVAIGNLDFVDSQLESCALISNSISVRNLDLFKNNFNIILREHKINLIV